MTWGSTMVLDAGGDPSLSSSPELVLKAVLSTIFDHPQRRKELVEKLPTLRNDPLLSTPPERKLNLDLTTQLETELAGLEKDTKLSRSELVRVSLVAAREDVRVNKELKKLVLLAP